jgi:hypothetical protein
MAGLYVLKYDDSITSAMNETQLAAYVKSSSNWDVMNWKISGKPGYANTGVLVTGHKYRIKWGKTGLDFDSMSSEITEEWKQNDKSLYFVHRFVDRRDRIKVTHNGNTIANNTIAVNPDDYVTG